MKMCQLVTGEERRELDMVFSFDHLETPGHVRMEDYAYDLNYFRDYMIDWMEHYGSNCPSKPRWSHRPLAVLPFSRYN